MLPFFSLPVTKTCKTCGLELPLDSFPIGKGNAGGRRPHCKPCYSKRTYQTRNPEACARASKKYGQTEKGQANLRKHSEKNKDARVAATNLWRQRMRDKDLMTDIGRKHHLKSKYGLTPERYDEMLDGQDGKCPICGRAEEGKRFAVDHDHNCCGEKKACPKCIRGLLCSGCNLALGHLSTKQHLQKALEYLDKAEQSQQLS